MRVAVWRYCLAFQTDRTSTVGGGRLARRVLEVLGELGHEVVIYGAVSKPDREWVADNYDWRQHTDCRDIDAAIVLPGPFNLRFGTGVSDTYKRLATMRKGALFCYAQWDAALPFNLAPEKSALFREQMGQQSWDLSHLQSVLMSQSPLAGWHHRPCFFEMEELSGDVLPLKDTPLNAVGYFGSDRPGRLKELHRFFCEDSQHSALVDIHGRWSDKSKQRLSCTNVAFYAPVPEADVRARLNSYAATLYMADPKYVKTDFVAQRLFENHMAGVPTLYSDKLQPTVREAISAAAAEHLIVSNGAQLRGLVDAFSDDPVFSREAREHALRMNESIVRHVAQKRASWRLSHVLRTIL